MVRTAAKTAATVVNAIVSPLGPMAVLTRLAEGLTTVGAASPAIARPSASASSAKTRYSASRTAAMRPGVAPTALSSPTLRACLAARPAASVATPPTARKLSSQLPMTRIGWLFRSMTKS
ncbi:hypothetical protein LUX73_24390 [Actinomadura madurae]|nr:hypothetical protein [Actinomadura madurae]